MPNPQMDSHYWAEVEHAEALRDQMIALYGQDSPQMLAKRATIAAEFAALEAHLTRELTEAMLAMGHRTA